LASTEKLRFVFDNNVLISAALIKSSVPDKAFDKAMNEGILLYSCETLLELEEVLGRQKFRKYIDNSDRIAFLNKLSGKSKAVKIKDKVTLCRDPKDNKFLELALSGKADFIISGDADLLTLHPFKNIPVISPASFLSL
jgi:putative PIN family toxin of toxin-antitoxin system